MMTSIRTLGGKVAIDMTHGFDCIVRGRIEQNFRSYEAARTYQRLHNAKADAIAKYNIGKPKAERKPVPAPCSILYYTA